MTAEALAAKKVSKITTHEISVAMLAKQGFEEGKLVQKEGAPKKNCTVYIIREITDTEVKIGVYDDQLGEDESHVLLKFSQEFIPYEEEHDVVVGYRDRVSYPL